MFSCGLRTFELHHSNSEKHDVSDRDSVTCRNTMMGASFQASIAALFFNALLDILLSPSKLQALQTFAVVDPLLEAPDEPAEDPTSVRIGQVSALVVVILNLAVILFSMLLFAVVVRLSIHTGATPSLCRMTLIGCLQLLCSEHSAAVSTGYYYKSCGHENALITVQDAVKLTLETQVCIHSTLSSSASIQGG
jgi:hypothetical protein